MNLVERLREKLASICEERLYHDGPLCKMPIGFKHSGNAACAAAIRRADLSDIAALQDKRIRELEGALQPFANFACSPPGECECNNCKARAALRGE